ncbi:MAG: M48 family metallopeptidase [Bacteroidetes bacterium]|nr:M48 family metallopeptidase [Bacteroidota bacterium]
MASTVPAHYVDPDSGTTLDASLSFDESSDDLIIELPSDTRLHWHLKGVKIFQSGTATSIYKKGNPAINLTFQDFEFNKFLKARQRKKGYVGFTAWLNSAGTFVYMLIFTGFFGIVLLGYFFILPWVAERAVDLLPSSFDDRIGKIIFDAGVSQEESDSAQTDRIRQFASKIDFKSSRTLKFFVIQSKEENAFALPDGNIVIFSGMLKIIHSENELAALMCHEAAHVKKRHSMKLLAKNLAAYLLISVVAGDVQGVMATLAKNANTLGTLTFSREFEEQADLEGLDILRHNQISAIGMTDLLHSLMEHDSKNLPGFLSTHPVTEKRIQYVDEAIAKNPFSGIEHEELKSIFTDIKR